MTTDPLPGRTLRRIVEVAQHAPSVHNTQPWRWRGSGTALDLYADSSRQLARSDPDGRNVVISGVALHHCVDVVAVPLGLRTHVVRLRDPEEPDLLARVEISPAEPS